MPDDADLAIETTSLRRAFGLTRAVDGVDLAVRRGSVLGVLGPNGAGKTTLMRVLATLLRPDSGRARVLGYDVVRNAGQVRARVALTGQFAAVDEDLTGSENLVLVGRLQGLSRAAARRRSDEVLAAFGLGQAAGHQVKKYSGGMRRRLDIAASLLTTPEVLFLDEPTTGLDPRSRQQVWRVVRAMAGTGTTVLLTTQYLGEADQLTDRVAVIDHGRIIAEGSSGELKASVGSGTLRVRVRDPEQRPAAERVLARALDTPVRLETDPAELSAPTTDPERAATAIRELSRGGVAARPPGAVSASRTFAWRVMLKIKHVPEQVADVIAIPVTFTVLFTYMFGGALAGSTSEYLQFLLPGTLAMTVVLLTMYTGIGLNTDLTTGLSDRFRSLPVWRPAPIVGALVGDVARYLLASLLVLGLGLLMGFRPDGGVLGVVAALGLILVFSFSLSWVCALIGVVSRTPSSVTVWSLVILFPPTLASNVFVDPDTMPGWLQGFVDVNPVSHLVTAVRGVMAGDVSVAEIGWVLVASATLVAVFAPLTMRAYYRRG